MSDERKDDGGQLAAAMELRDYFAAQALAGMLAGHKCQAFDGPDDVAVAMAAYKYADAMLDARKAEPRHCPTCRHHTLDDRGDHWCALGISTAGRVPGLVTHLQPFGCSLHEGKETT